MRTIGIKPGDRVLLIERRDERELVYNALVVSMSMEEALVGPQGHGAITVAFVVPERAIVTATADVVHLTHRDWLEGRAGLAYEELLRPIPGICKFCWCTEERACAGGCYWVDLLATVCSSVECRQKYRDEVQRGLEALYVAEKEGATG